MNIGERNDLAFYKTEVGNQPLLSDDEEQALFLRVVSGDQTARNELVRRNLRLVIKIANRYSDLTKSANLSLSDLVQEGNIGLIRAVDQFDTKRGVKFSTYAAVCIEKRIIATIKHHGKPIRLKGYAETLLYRYRVSIDELTAKYGRKPTEGEIAVFMGVTVNDIRKIQSTIFSFRGSNWTNDDGEDVDIIDVVPDKKNGRIEEKTEQKIMQKNLMSAASQILNDTERQILFGRIGYQNGAKTLQEISNEIGISAERIRQIETKIYRKLRDIDFGSLGYKANTDLQK